MLNTEHAYFEAGYKCGQARVRRDEGLASHWRKWLARAIDLEKHGDDKWLAAKLFRDGYAEAQPQRKPEYFR